ncbi:MAG TPA: hypothetical protein VGL56_01450 [Fimbriimonadaceae bacterium]|jgi:hypothetical protein
MKYYALCLPLVLGSLALAKADKAGEAKKGIKAAYDQMAKDFLDKKFDGFSTLMTDDFQATREGHKEAMSRDDVIKDFKAQRDRLTDVKWTKTVTKFDRLGMKWKRGSYQEKHYTELVLRAWVVGRMTATMNLGDSKPHLFDLQAKSEDLWVHVIGSDWKLKSSHTSNIVVKIDGKVAPMN